MPTPVPITVAHGDGIGPEIMAATLHILKEAGAALEIDTIEVGEKVYLNVNTRKMLGLYANIRPCVSYHPFVRTKHPGMDVVIVRENEEDLYAGIEYQATPDEIIALKVISRPGSEKIVRYAFE